MENKSMRAGPCPTPNPALCLLVVKEMERALKDVYTDDIASEKVQELAELVRAVSETQFDRQLFGAMCALSERLFYTSFV